jgi:plastocyanin
VTTFDSRALTYVDTFGQRFGKPDKIRYRLASAAVICQQAGEDLPFELEVSEDKGGKQHDVTVRVRGQQLVADPPKLSIKTGDLVLWHSVASTPGYAVQGKGKTIEFDSSSLTSETLFTHAFGVEGEFEWTDAIDRALSGRVNVSALDSGDRKQCAKWMRALQRGTVVVIEGKRADPGAVDILVGQTVFFAIAAAKGITITDVQLLPG